MNSDELRAYEQPKKPTVEAEGFENEQLDQEPVAKGPDNLQKQNLPEDGTPQPQKDTVEQDGISPVNTESQQAAVPEQAKASQTTPELALSDQVSKLSNPAIHSTSVAPSQSASNTKVAELTQTVANLERQERELRQIIAALQDTQSKILADQLAQTQATIDRMIQEGLGELEQRKQALSISIEQLERRRERIRTEMRTSFAGVSQDLAIRVQGFKDYLVGSLQDLASTAEQLDLVPIREASTPAEESPSRSRPREQSDKAPSPQFAEQAFQEQVRQIRKILDQYRTLPDYYGPPWQLRRTFEPVHAERVSNWFLSQGGRGAIKSMGSRLQNILIGSAVISVLRQLYGDRVRTLILGNTPERLGEWRRGLQDCLGISRADFGPERGIVLFEEASALVQKADRLLAQKQLPLIIVDETEDQISLSMLQFPLWLAFAADPQQASTYQQY